MANGVIQGPVDSTGKRVDNQTHVRSSDDVYRQRIVSLEPFGDDLAEAVAAAGVWQQLPTSEADVATGDCRVRHVVLSNTHASNVLTVTIKDKSGTPRYLFNARPLAPGEVLSIPACSAKFLGGLVWVASGVGVYGAVVVCQ